MTSQYESALQVGVSAAAVARPDLNARQVGAARPEEQDGGVTARDGPVFEFEHLWVGDDENRWRLRDVTGQIPAGGVAALLGPSGSGKSTLLRCCNRLVAPSKGTVRYWGSDVAGLDVLQLRRQVAMVFQTPIPLPGTVRDNLRLADPTLDHVRAAALLDRVHLDTGFLDRNATQLSGGEAQRLCLARSLAVGPDVVLMDEVTSSVDPTARKALEELARSLADGGISIVWVTHDLAQAQRLADTILVVIGGRFADTKEAAAFLGEDSHGE
jgi:putative ABC transport system ATP-binding protein